MKRSRDSPIGERNASNSRLAAPRPRPSVSLRPWSMLSSTVICSVIATGSYQGSTITIVPKSIRSVLPAK